MTHNDLKVGTLLWNKRMSGYGIIMAVTYYKVNNTHLVRVCWFDGYKHYDNIIDPCAAFTNWEAFNEI